MPKRRRTVSDSGRYLAKRLRASLNSLDSPVFALTEDNLAHLQASIMPRTPSPKRIDNNLDRRDKLEAYGIDVDRGCDLPAALIEHISTVIEAPRELDAVPSPNAKQLVQRRRNAALQPERNGITQIAPFLGFIGEVEGTPGLALDPLLATKQDLALHSFFLPSAPNPAVATTWKVLSQPQPDVCTGYVTRRDAETVSPPCAAAFTADEEAILDRYRLSQFLHFPFLTMQYKAANANETLHVDAKTPIKLATRSDLATLELVAFEADPGEKEANCCVSARHPLGHVRSS